MKNEKALFLFLILLLAWSNLALANEIWSSRERNDSNFVRIQTRSFSHSPDQVNRQVHMCLYDQGQETCFDYPSHMTPVGEHLFARNVTGWADFFQRCREFDARNRFIITTQLASFVATGGLGAMLGATRVGVTAATLTGVVSPDPQAYPSVPQDALNEAEMMMLFLLMGEGHYRVDSLQEMAKFKMAMELCSAHLNVEVQRDNHRECMQGCHGSNSENAEVERPTTRDFQNPTFPFSNSESSMEEIRSYLESIQ